MTADVIVLGLGGMGSAVAAELARRGHRVVGLEQFAAGHALGSSHGHTRIIRTAYYEHPAYVPLCRESFAGWHALEQRTGRHLLTNCPVLSLGPADGELIAGVRRAAGEHGLPVEQLALDDIRRRYPPFVLPADTVGVLEQQSGFLFVDDCVRALHDDARAAGADLHFEEPAVAWTADGAGVTVTTGRREYRAAQLVIAAGPWAGHALRWPLTVMRQVVFWLRPADPEPFRRDRFPIFLIDRPDAAVYGLPMLDPRGVKLAVHYGAPELPGPDAVSREITAGDEARIRDIVRRYLPAADGPVGGSSVCIYTLTPDRHFVIDRHPAFGNVAVAAGFSGHGFKFAPAVGRMVAELLDGGGALELFRAGRLAPLRPASV